MLFVRERAKAVLTAAYDNALMRYCPVRAPPLSAENEDKENHQPRSDSKRGYDRRHDACLRMSQFVQTLDSRGTMRVGSSENASFYFVKFGIDIGSIQLVGSGAVAGIDRSEHAID